ncbi:MAG TPA: hypothetical protein VJP40_02045, partial [bacterium]|nr:hypothetical protein [bacterium]
DGVNCGGSAFGGGGFVTTDFGGDDSRALGLALQSDGKIMAAGYSNVDGTRDFALARYNSDGSLDGTFNPSGSFPGTVVTDFAGAEDEAHGVAIYPEGDPNAGKIVLAGFATATDEDLALARYCPDGSLDSGSCGGSAFSPNGKRTFNTGVTDRLNGLVIQADGKVVGAGFSNGGLDDDFVLLRLCGDGNLDDGSSCGGEGFGDSGITTLDLSAGSQDQANAVALQADAKILAAGASDAAGFGDDFALARFGTDGNLDFGFGSAGYILQDFSCLCSDSTARSMALQADGKIILSGASDANNSSGFNDFALARFFGDAVAPLTPTADLAATLTADPSDPRSGDLVTFTVTVTNLGPDAVSEVTLSNLLIGTFSELAADSEACTLGQGAVSCALGSLANGESVTVNLSLKLSDLPFSFVANASGSLVDSNNANNQAVLTFGEASGGDDGGCSLNAGSPGPWNPAWLGLLAAIGLLWGIRRYFSNITIPTKATIPTKMPARIISFSIME